MKYFLFAIALMLHSEISMQPSQTKNLQDFREPLLLEHVEKEGDTSKLDCANDLNHFESPMRLNQDKELQVPLNPGIDSGRCDSQNSVIRDPDMLRFFFQLWQKSKPDS